MVIQSGPKKTSKIENARIQKVLKFLQQHFQGLFHITSAFYSPKMKVKQGSDFAVQ